MKTKILSVVVVVLAGCLPKDTSEPRPERPRRDLGWIVYDGVSWDEVEVGKSGPEQHVVQLGMDRREVCSDGRVCFEAHLVTDLEDARDHRLCPRELGRLATQYAVGRYTGVVVWTNQEKEEYVVVTAKHAKGYPHDRALASHDLGHSSCWLRDGTLEVPKEFVYETQSLRDSHDLDILVLDVGLVGKNRGVVLAEEVENGMKVDAFIHPFGIPMKVVRGAEVENCDATHCSIAVNMAVGGSGGPVFTKDGQLAGILVGTGMEATSNTDHEGDRSLLHPCNCTSSRAGCSDFKKITVEKCKNGQRFVRAEAIGELIEKQERRQ